MAQNVNAILRKVFVVVMFTFIPMLIIKQLWNSIITHWLLILAILLTGLATIFEYVYFMDLSIRDLLTKFKKLIGIQETAVTHKKSGILAYEKKEGFLLSGIALDILAFYFFNKYFRFQ